MHAQSETCLEAFNQIRGLVPQILNSLSTLQQYVTQLQKESYELNPVNAFSTARGVQQLHIDLLSVLKSVRPSMLMEEAFSAISPQLNDLLPAVSFTYLCSTSSSMFDVLSPFISNSTHIVTFLLLMLQANKLPFAEKKYFKHYSPDTIVNVESCAFSTPAIAVEFSTGFNDSITELPISITRITFGKFFNHPLYTLPPALTHLTFPYESEFNQPIRMPSSLVYVKFGLAFNHILNDFPPFLQVLKLGLFYGHSITYLPETLRKLRAFNSPIYYLPSSLKQLSYFPSFASIHCALPPSLTILRVAGGMNLSNLPPSLIYLHVYGRRQQGFLPELNHLPASLSRLVIGGDWEGHLEPLPPSLTSLTIDSTNFHEPLNNLPHSLTSLHLLEDCASPLNLTGYSSLTNLSINKTTMDSLPPNIIFLTFGNSFNDPVSQLPLKITRLNFGNDFNESVDNLAPNIIHLCFGSRFNRPVAHLPHTITHLAFSHDFNHPVNNLPPNITHLSFGHSFNQPVDHLPSFVSRLKFGDRFNQKVDHLPHSLLNLSFGYSFNQNIDLLPPALTRLKLGFSFTQPTRYLPPSLTHLTLNLHTKSLWWRVRTLHFPANLQDLKIVSVNSRKGGEVDTSDPSFAIRFTLWQRKIMILYNEFSISNKIGKKNLQALMDSSE